MRPLARIMGLVLVLAAGCSPPRPATPIGVPVHRTPTAATPDSAELVLLGTTDVHGRLYPYDYYRVARPTTGWRCWRR